MHIGIVSFLFEGCLKFDLLTVTANDPKMTSDQKFLNRDPKRTAGQEALHPRLIKIYQIM